MVQAHAARQQHKVQQYEAEVQAHAAMHASAAAILQVPNLPEGLRARQFAKLELPEPQAPVLSPPSPPPPASPSAPPPVQPRTAHALAAAAARASTVATAETAATAAARSPTARSAPAHPRHPMAQLPTATASSVQATSEFRFTPQLHASLQSMSAEQCGSPLLISANLSVCHCKQGRRRTLSPGVQRVW